MANLSGIFKQMDIKTACLMASIGDKVNMLQLEGFDKLDPDSNPFVCKLIKSIYGLKMSRENWFFTFKRHLETIGYEACKHDLCLFIEKRNKSWAMICVGIGVFFLLSVDRILRVVQGEDIKEFHYY